MALLWGQHTSVWGRKLAHSQCRWRLPGILSAQWSSGYTIIRVCSHLNYYKPKYKHHFLEMCFLSVREFWFTCEMPLQPRSMRHPLPVPFLLWAVPLLPATNGTTMGSQWRVSQGWAWVFLTSLCVSCSPCLFFFGHIAHPFCERWKLFCIPDKNDEKSSWLSCVASDGKICSPYINAVRKNTFQWLAFYPNAFKTLLDMIFSKLCWGISTALLV